MSIRGRSFTAAFMACLILVVFVSPADPSYNTEAGRKYAVACDRLTDLRKSRKKKKYRSYWIDCIRTFESVQKKYPKSPSAADACFDRAAVYFELYQFNKYGHDLDESMQAYSQCQSAYPSHVKAPEALYRVIDLSVEFKRNQPAASKAYSRLCEIYPDSSWTGKAKMRLGVPGSAVKQEPEKTVVRPATASKPAKAGIVNNVRFWSGGAYTRIVIDGNEPIRFQAQELKNPDRLVFDLLNVRVAKSVNKDPLSVNDGILKQVRVSQHTADTVRVVLDLASIKSYVAFPLNDPNRPRLVIDVTGEGVGAAGGAMASSESGSQQKVETSSSGTQTQTKASEDERQAPPKSKLNTAALPPKISPQESSDAEKVPIGRQLGLKIRTIAIDAGHGGYDPGAIGKNGLKEKNVTLDIARRLAILIKERLGCNVIMTRDRDVFVPLEDRPAIAKTKGADLFVSIHINSNRKRNARGIETYVQGLRASDKDAMATAARENATTTKTLNDLDSELKKILRGLRKSDSDEESLYLADSVQGSLVKSLKPINRHAGDLKVKMKRAFFYVLINTEMPSILAEVGFISNPDEEKLLNTSSYRESIAEALCKGLKKYIDARSSQIMGI